MAAAAAAAATPVAAQPVARRSLCPLLGCKSDDDDGKGEKGSLSAVLLRCHLMVATTTRWRWPSNAGQLHHAIHLAPLLVERAKLAGSRRKRDSWRRC